MKRNSRRSSAAGGKRKGGRRTRNVEEIQPITASVEEAAVERVRSPLAPIF